MTAQKQVLFTVNNKGRNRGVFALRCGEHLVTQSLLRADLVQLQTVLNAAAEVWLTQRVRLGQVPPRFAVGEIVKHGKQAWRCTRHEPLIAKRDGKRVPVLVSVFEAVFPGQPSVAKKPKRKQS